MTSDLGMIEFAEDEGREVLDLLVGGEGVGEHGGVSYPLLWPSHGVGLPASSIQQGLSRLLVTVPKVFLLQSDNVLLTVFLGSGHSIFNRVIVECDAPVLGSAVSS